MANQRQATSNNSVLTPNQKHEMNINYMMRCSEWVELNSSSGLICKKCASAGNLFHRHLKSSRDHSLRRRVISIRSSATKRQSKSTECKSFSSPPVHKNPSTAPTNCSASSNTVACPGSKRMEAKFFFHGKPLSQDGFGTTFQLHKQPLLAS